MKQFNFNRADLNSPRDMIRHQLALEELSNTSKETKKIRKTIYEMFTSKQSKSKSTASSQPTSPSSIFCGTIPVNVNTATSFRTNLTHHSYYVSEKLKTSSRYLLFSHRQLGVFLIDQQSRLIKIDMNLPVAPWTADGRTGGRQHGTLLDGELIYQTLGGGRNDEVIYLISDALLVDGHETFRLPLNERLAVVQARILSARHSCTEKSMLTKLKREKIRLQMRPMYHVSECQYLLHLQTKPNNVNIGLLFVPINTPYVVGESQHVFEWERSTTDAAKDVVADEDLDLDNMDDEEDEEEEEEEENEDDANDIEKAKAKENENNNTMTEKDLLQILKETGQNIDTYAQQPIEFVSTSSTSSSATKQQSIPSASSSTSVSTLPVPTMPSDEIARMNESKTIRQRILATFDTTIGTIGRDSFMIGSENMVQTAPSTHTITNQNIAYYQDINKSWPFYTSKRKGYVISDAMSKCSCNCR